MLRILALILFTASVVGCGRKEVQNLNELNREMDQADAKSKVVAAPPSEPAFDVSITPESIAAGNAIYQKMCAPCHGAGGKGDGVASAFLNPKPRDHSNGAYMDTLTNRHIYNVIKNGGAQYGYPTMPGQPQLPDDQVTQIIAFVRSLSRTYKP